MVIKRILEKKKSRKFPIQRDEYGDSLRARCRSLFDEKLQPAEVAKMLNMKVDTARKYYQQWKQTSPNYEANYTFIKDCMKKDSPNRDSNLELLSRIFEISREELDVILAKPHGLKRLLTGKLQSPRQINTAKKQHVVLEIALFLFNYLEKKGGKLEDILYALDILMRKRKSQHEEREAFIEEENWYTSFARETLKASEKMEREGRSKIDRLTREEENKLIRYGMEARANLGFKESQVLYWIRLGELMTEGLTKEQAREKIYHDLVNKGDIEGAKQMRGFQNTVHPLEPDDGDASSESCLPSSEE